MAQCPPLSRALYLLVGLFLTASNPETARAALSLAAEAVVELAMAAKEQTSIPLAPYFEDPDVHGTLVRFQTNAPDETDFYVELFDEAGSAPFLTPGTADNFLAYVQSDRYNETFIHRSVPGFVIQGGGYGLISSASGVVDSVVEVESFGQIANEFGNLNKRGTIAMAKLSGDLDSATSQWFVNLNDNPSLDVLDSQGGGLFTAFGRVVGNGMDVIDLLAAAPRYNFGSTFAELPLWDYDPNADLLRSDFLLLEDVAVAASLPLLYEASQSGDALQSATVVDGELILESVARPTGRSQSTVTVNAVSAIDGSAATMTFVVTLDAKPGLPVGVLNLLLEDEAPGLPADQ